MKIRLVILTVILISASALFVYHAVDAAFGHNDNTQINISPAALGANPLIKAALETRVKALAETLLQSHDMATDTVSTKTK